MKKVLLFIFILSSCGPYSVVDKKIAEYIKNNAHNPDSYEPIETKLMYVTYLIDDLQTEIRNAEEGIKTAKEDLKRYKSYSSFSNRWSSFINESKENIIKYEQKIVANKISVDSISNSENKKPIKSVTYIHQCRINVPLGGKMLKNITVVFDNKMNIISFQEQNIF